MVKLRDFEEETTEGEYVPWTLVPVPPRVHTPVGGKRDVVVDTRRLGANVRPTADAAGRPEDAAYREAVSSEDDDAPRRKRQRRRSSPAGGTPGGRVCLPPCSRCGVMEHGAGDCSEFGRDRGAACAPGSTSADLGHEPRPAGMRAAGVEVLPIEAGPDVLYVALSTALQLLGGCHGDAGDATRDALRTWVEQNRRTPIGSRTLEAWIAADSDKQWRIDAYVAWISGAVWAGPIECAAFAISRGVNVHIWRHTPAGDSFVRHARFEPTVGASIDTVHLLHTQGRHFDVLKHAARRSR